MSTKRTYGDSCGIARALDAVGERWALLVVRELVLGPKRFTDLRRGLPNVGPDVLTERLRELGAAGIVQRTTLPPPAASQVYELTDRGRELEPVILALGRWGAGAPFPAGMPAFGPDSMVLALKTMFSPAAAGGLDTRVELRLDGDRFNARIADGSFDVARGAADEPDLTIEADPATLADVLWRNGSLDRLTIGGSRAAARRFLRLFAAG